MKKKDWNFMFNDVGHVEVGNTLAEAKTNIQRYYRGVCKVHGNTILTTLDNACPQCQNINAQLRRKNNTEFNRTREKFFEIQRRAESKNIPFELSIDDIRTMITETKVCPVFGVDLVIGGGDNAPSIDRLDSSKGYVVGNVIVMSSRANRIKNNATADEVMQVALWMKRYERTN
jgi:hypothetical protein